MSSDKYILSFVIIHRRSVSILSKTTRKIEELYLSCTRSFLRYCCGKHNVRACQRPQSCLYPREFPHVAGNFVPNYSTAPTKSFSWSFCYPNKKGQAFGKRKRLNKRLRRIFVHSRSDFLIRTIALFTNTKVFDHENWRIYRTVWHWSCPYSRRAGSNKHGEAI